MVLISGPQSLPTTRQSMGVYTALSRNETWTGDVSWNETQTGDVSETKQG